IRDEVFTLVVAGHETTASALCWTWYLVAGHPAVAAAVRAEASAASDADRARPAADRFPHAYRAIAEALRLYPPGWVLTRRALEATSIAGVDVERGDDILVSPFLVHRHPAFWDDAEAFDPTRFVPERAAVRSRFAYLPFGLGPRAASASRSRSPRCSRTWSRSRIDASSSSCRGSASNGTRASTCARARRSNSPQRPAARHDELSHAATRARRARRRLRS